MNLTQEVCALNPHLRNLSVMIFDARKLKYLQHR